MSLHINGPRELCKRYPEMTTEYYEMRSGTSAQSWTKGSRQIDELSKIGFSMQCFTADFLRFFYQKTSKFGF